VVDRPVDMIRRLRALFGLIGILFCVGRLSPDVRAGPLRVLLDDNYPPYVFRGANGELQGILTDQWREWERVTGRPVELLGMDWNEAQRQMRSGAGDVIDTMFDTPERRLIYDFGPPYAKIDVTVFFFHTIGGIASLSDLKGFHVAAKAGDACIDYLRAKGVTDIIQYPSYEAIVRAAAAGEEKIFCIDRPPALYFLDKFGIEGNFRSSISIPSGEFHRAVLKGESELLRTIEDGFDAIPRSTYDAIDQKWLGSRLASPLDTRITIFAAAGVMVLLAMLLFVDRGLRRRIALATAELKRQVRELESSQAKNRAFIAALPDLSFTLDREGRYLECNAPAEEQLLLPRVELLGKLVSEIGLEPEMARRFMDCIRQSLDERRLVVLEYDLKVPAGHEHFEGRFVPLDADRVVLIARDVTEAKRHEELLKESLAEKEILLREVHHRVKNNLQIISSIISLQEASGPGAGDTQGKDIQTRIMAMASLHEFLYGSDDLSSIDIAAYLTDLVGEMTTSFSGGKSQIAVNLQSDIMHIDEAMPLGLLATELISNALKYAYPAGNPGRILVAYANSGTERRLEISDEGAGLPPGFDAANSTTLGYTLIYSLAHQLNGKLSLDTSTADRERPGLRVVLTFPPAARLGRKGELPRTPA